MARKIFFILTLLLSVIVSIAVTLLTGIFFFILVGLIPLVYHFKNESTASERVNFIVDEKPPQVLYCPNCGARIIKGFSYCPHCGVKIGETE